MGDDFQCCVHLTNRLVRCPVGYNAHLCDRLHFFMLLVQARAGDAVPEEFHKKSVLISFVCFLSFVDGLELELLSA